MNPHTETSDEWLAIGVECVYRHRAPFGLATEQFKAKVRGFTASGRVRIEAFDRQNNEWYKTTVGRKSLRPASAE